MRPKIFDLLFNEAGRQIDVMRPQYPDAVFLDLTRFLTPSEKYFWDLSHVYDEANMVLAERIYTEIRPVIDSSKWKHR